MYNRFLLKKYSTLLVLEQEWMKFTSETARIRFPKLVASECPNKKKKKKNNNNNNNSNNKAIPRTAFLAVKNAVSYFSIFQRWKIAHNYLKAFVFKQGVMPI